jgi:hypothetical protein
VDTVREKIGERSRAGVPIYDVREFRSWCREHIRIAVAAFRPRRPRPSSWSYRPGEGRADFRLAHSTAA